MHYLSLLSRTHQPLGFFSQKFVKSSSGRVKYVQRTLPLYLLACTINPRCCWLFISGYYFIMDICVILNARPGTIKDSIYLKQQYYDVYRLTVIIIHYHWFHVCYSVPARVWRLPWITFVHFWRLSQAQHAELVNPKCQPYNFVYVPTFCNRQQSADINRNSIVWCLGLKSRLQCISLHLAYRYADHFAAYNLLSSVRV